MVLHLKLHPSQRVVGVVAGTVVVVGVPQSFVYKFSKIALQHLLPAVLQSSVDSHCSFQSSIDPAALMTAMKGTIDKNFIFDFNFN